MRQAGLERGVVERAELGDDGLIRGTASTVVNADRMGRVLLPGAWQGSTWSVPFLLNHKDDTPIGQTTFTAGMRGKLDHATEIVGDPVQPGTGVPIRDLLRKGYPATSIGWLPHKAYYGWRNLMKAAANDPELAAQVEQAAAMGVEQDEGLRYFAKVEVVENSLVPIPANPHALLEAASLLSDSPARAELEAMVEIAAGARHSQDDASAIQHAHDDLVRAGAACTVMPAPGTGTNAPGHASGDYLPSDNGIKGGWHQHMRSSFNEIEQLLRDHGVADSEFLASQIDDLQQSAATAYDPDHDGDDDSSPQTDTDHDYYNPDGSLTAKGKAAGLQPKPVRENSAQLSTSTINDLPDSDFAYIEPGGTKDSSGKTVPRSLRHFPIHDAAHVRNALSRAPQSPFGSKAMPKIRAAAKKFGIDVSDDNQSSAAEAVEAASLYLPTTTEFDQLERELSDLSLILQ